MLRIIWDARGYFFWLLVVSAICLMGERIRPWRPKQKPEYADRPSQAPREGRSRAVHGRGRHQLTFTYMNDIMYMMVIFGRRNSRNQRSG